ncbi:hypothetical protein U1Q18_033255 [Sarracenia purpurea var. burkii]
MEDFASLWSYQESHDELKQKFLYATLELESVRAEANEEMRKNKECVKQLMQLLKIACHERDEARDHLQKLLNKLMPSSVNTLTHLPQIDPDSPLVKPTKPNSSITESNSLSDTYNYHSYGSSPVDSFFDDVSPSPDLCNIKNIPDSSNNLAFVNQSFDQGSLVIDSIVKGKPLPQKGKLLPAVLEAGPLLQTLLVAGPLPRWRNPPPLQTFHIPPVSIKSHRDNSAIATQKPAANPSCVLKLLNSSPFIEMSCGSSEMFSTTPMLNFGSSASGTDAYDYVSAGKRQRLQ